MKSPVPIDKKSWPVKRMFEKLLETSVVTLASFALLVPISSVNLITAVPPVVSSSDTNPTL